MAFTKAEAFMVSVDFSKGLDVGVMLVGKKTENGSTKILNAFQGEEAMQLYKKLCIPEVKKV
jgi:hypothetical protein